MTAVRDSSNITVEDGTATVKGWVQDVRALGGIAFVTLRDRFGTIQITLPKKKIDPALFEELTKLPRESVVAVTGEVKASNQTALGLEIIPSAVEVYSKAATPLPLGVVDKVNVEMDTRLNHRFMDLRKPEIRAIFELKAMMVELIEECVRENGFNQVYTPKINAAGAEGGAELFKIQYFDKPAFLAQSPQLYKQILMSTGLDRVFELGPAFRAELSNTNRHVTEFISFDGEMSWIENEEEVMAKLPLGLGEWTTSVATMAPTNELMGRGQMLKKLMWAYLKIGDIAQVEEVTEALYREMRYDLSGDMQSERKLLCQSLMKSGDERLQQAASRLLEASQRMGGEHQMQEVGTWLQQDLAKSMEADLLVAQTRKVSRQQVVEEAKALPSDLYHHWLTDARTFARVLYGMRLAREDVLRVLSCLIWLDRTAEEEVCTLTEEDVFVRRVVDETKLLFKHERNKADGIRQVMNKLGRSDAETELDAWIEGRETPAARAIEEQTGAIERVLRQQAEALRQMARQPRTETINGDKYVMESGSQQVQMALPLGTDAAEVAGRLTGGVHQ